MQWVAMMMILLPPSLSPTLHCLHLLALECKLQVTLEKWPPVAKALDAVLDPLPTNCHIHLSSAWLIINLTNLLIFVLDEARIIATVCACPESPDWTGHSKMTLCTKNSSATTTVPSRDHPRVCNTQTTTGPILEQNRIWPVPPPTWSYTWPFFCFLTKHSLPVNSLLLFSVASALVGAPVLAFACLSPLATACLFITANKRGFILRMACYVSWSRCNREIK